MLDTNLSRDRRLGARQESRPLAGFALDGIEEGARGIEIQGVAELVRLRRPCGFHARGLFARVVSAEAALAERPEKIAKRAIAEEIQGLVGDLEAHGRLAGAPDAPAAPLTLGLEVRRSRDV